MATQKSPWAVLLCKVKSDATGRFDPNSEPPNAPGVLPFRTVCENFFTNANAGFNAVRFFSDMSHGKLDLSDSQVLGWYTLAVNITGYTNVGDPILDKTQGEVIALARQAAMNAGVPLNSFVGVVVIMNLATGWAQGAPGWVAADWRRVDGRNFDGTLWPSAPGGGNGTEIFGQEMGHGFGLGHSRKDGSNVDYGDPWDIMSTLQAFSGSDINYSARGPGLNAWNMRSRGWLDESRVWHCPPGDFSTTIKLRPLHRHDLPGFLAAELPPINSTGGFPEYLVEYRKKENWDEAIPRSCILIHRYEGPVNGMNINVNHSYIMPGTRGNFDLAAGDSFGSFIYGFGPGLFVIDIDDNTDTATVALWMNHLPIVPVFDPWWWIKTHGGLVPPGPPPPFRWIQHFAAALTLAETANTVAPELRSSVLKIALKQLAVTVAAIKKEIGTSQRKSSPD